MDIMDVEIMEDGVVKIKTKELSEANHVSADELLDAIEDALGGERKTEQLEHDFWKTRAVVRNKAGKVRIQRR